MASFWRIFKVKTKPSPAAQDVDRPEVKTVEEWNGDPPNLDRSRNRGDRMSVSRSGRYKQRCRRRSGLFDNPNLANDVKKTPQKPVDVENDENCMRQANGHQSEAKVANAEQQIIKSNNESAPSSPALQTTL